MPRRPRPLDPEGIYHVVVRGDNREPVFVDNADRQEYLGRLSGLKRDFAFACYAYALMTNHVHLLLRPGHQITISKLMQLLNVGYTKYFNRRYRRIGHLYQGRFYSALMQRESHLLEATRYIHLNPVRAAMVRHPKDYRWTSYHAYRQAHENRPSLVDTHFILTILGSLRFFDRFIEDGIESDGSHQQAPASWPPRVACQLARLDGGEVSGTSGA